MKGILIALLCSSLCGLLNAQSISPADGKHVYSYANGTDSVICFYKNGRLIGQWTEYYPSGQLHLSKTYKEGHLKGMTQYYEDGTLKRNESYDGFSIQGHLYDEDGKEIDFIPYYMLPQFPGGNEELAKLIRQYLKYPSKALKDKVQGTVLIKCHIDKDGNPQTAKVIKSAGQELDKEAMRVVGFLTMTYKFIPGKLEGNPVGSYLTIPVSFRL